MKWTAFPGQKHTDFKVQGSSCPVFLTDPNNLTFLDIDQISGQIGDFETK